MIGQPAACRAYLWFRSTRIDAEPQVGVLTAWLTGLAGEANAFRHQQIEPIQLFLEPLDAQLLLLVRLAALLRCVEILQPALVHRDLITQKIEMILQLLRIHLTHAPKTW